jgi:GTPase
MQENFKAGYISILGKPNAGKSTLLNLIMGDKLAIISPKVQTTRHRIMGIYNQDNCQIVFSDTPGIIAEPEYGMHKRMMLQVQASIKDADVIVYLVDCTDDLTEAKTILDQLKLSTKIVVAFNKIDKIKPENLVQHQQDSATVFNNHQIVYISAKTNLNVNEFLVTLIDLLPVHPPFFEGDDISDKPMKFFVAEIIREQLFHLLDKEIPYHSTVFVEAYQEKQTLTKIIANIVVMRESQKSIILGQGGSMIKKIGSQARAEIEKFIDNKVFLELHVKVRDNWRNKENFLNEYGY